MTPNAIDNSPWQQFADYYFADTATRQRVAQDWQRLESKYDPVLKRGDKLADPLGRAIIDGQISRADFERALTRGIDQLADPAPALQAFFRSVDHLPRCIEIDAVARGAVVLRQIPITVLLTHGIVAGFVFAAINANAAIPLSLNKSIARATQRRYIETTKYVADTLAPGGMNRFGGGFQSACRVRLVHAMVRSEIGRHYQWNHQAYGAPIHPVALLAASAVPDVWAIRFSQKHGCYFSTQDLHDIAMHNAYLAYLHGVPEELLITDYDAFCDFLCWAICQSPLPLAADRAKALSVLNPLLKNGYPLSANSAVNWFFNQTVLTATRTIMGDKLCDAYEVPDSRHARPLSAALAALNGILVGARRIPPLQGIYRRGTGRYWDVTVPQMVQQITGRSEVRYETTAQTSR